MGGRGVGCFLHAHCGLGAPPRSLIQSPWHSLKLVMLSFFYEEVAQGHTATAGGHLFSEEEIGVEAMFGPVPLWTLY